MRFFFLTAPHALALALLSSPALQLQGQTKLEDVTHLLKGKPLLFRFPSKASHQQFDLQGKLLDKPQPLSFTLSGFDFLDARITGKGLEISGKRVGLEFDRKGESKRVVLNKLNFGSKIDILIAGPPDADFLAATAGNFRFKSRRFGTKSALLLGAFRANTSTASE